MKLMSVIALSLLMLLALPNGLTAQDINVVWGEEFKTNKKERLIRFIGYTEDGYYSLKYNKKNFHIDHFNNDNQFVASEILDLEQGNKTKAYEHIEQINGSCYLFSSFANKQTKKNYLFVQEYDLSTLSLVGKMSKIGEIDFAKKWSFNSGSFRFTHSRDESKILVTYYPPYSKNEPEKLGLIVLNTDLEVLWSKEDNLPYPDKLFDIKLSRVDNDGNVYVAGTLREEKAEAKKHKGYARADYHVLTYSDQGKKVKDFELKPDNKVISTLEFSVDEKGNLICGGFYKDRDHKGLSGIKGSFFLTLDGETKEILKSSFDEFSLDFIMQNFTVKQEKKAKKKLEKKGKEPLLYEYQLDEVILRDDGGAVLIGEQFYIRVTTSTHTDSQGNTTTTTTYHYYYNDIIVVSINPQGDIEWTHKIPKKQYSTNDGGPFSSYAHAVIGDKICFVFNDHPENSYHKEGEKLTNFSPRRDSEVVAVTIDSKGDISRQVVAKQEGKDLLLEPKQCEQISNNELVIFARWKKGRKYGKITFE